MEICALFVQKPSDRLEVKLSPIICVISDFFSGRTRTKDKYRIVYSDHQRLELEKEFHYSRYITIRRKAELANSVGLSERQVILFRKNQPTTTMLRELVNLRVIV